MRSAGSAVRWRRIALIVGIPGLPVLLAALLVGATLVLFGLGSAGAVGARDDLSRSAVRSAGVPDADLAVYRAVGARVNVPWQLLAALADAQARDAPADAAFAGPFRIRLGAPGITEAGSDSLPVSAGFIAVRLRNALTTGGVRVTADLLTEDATPDQGGGFDNAETGSGNGDLAASRRRAVIDALAGLPVRNANQPFMSGVHDTAVRWALGRATGTATCGSTAVADARRPGTDGMPYPLPAAHGFTGAEEPIDENGRVPSGRGNGVVTWSRFAALGPAYRDFYITMRWNYAAWNWDGTSTDIDQAQFAWFAEKPRLVLVGNPRTGASIVAAALEAGPAPWVGVTSSGARGSGADHGWPGAIRGTPAGYTGIVSGFPPAALAALGDASGPVRTGYAGQDGDDLTYQWAPDQDATPGPTQWPATDAPETSTTATARCPARDAAVPGTAQVAATGPAVTIPAGQTVDPAAAGRRITAPNDGVARGLAAGLTTVGLPYVWGGGTDGNGPDNGCARGGGQKNSCGTTVGLDCSGLTGWTLTNAGFRIPTNSSTQRAGGTDVARENGLPGDIIGWPGHVAVYLGTINGVDYLLEAPDVGLQVRVRPVNWAGADPVLHRYWS